jgi:hypothetical protein
MVLLCSPDCETAVYQHDTHYRRGQALKRRSRRRHLDSNHWRFPLVFQNNEGCVFSTRSSKASPPFLILQGFSKEESLSRQVMSKWYCSFWKLVISACIFLLRINYLTFLCASASTDGEEVRQDPLLLFHFLSVITSAKDRRSTFTDSERQRFH